MRVGAFESLLLSLEILNAEDEKEESFQESEASRKRWARKEHAVSVLMATGAEGLFALLGKVGFIGPLFALSVGGIAWIGMAVQDLQTRMDAMEKAPWVEMSNDIAALKTDIRVTKGWVERLVFNLLDNPDYM